MIRTLWMLSLTVSSVASAQNATLQQMLEAAEKNNVDRRTSIEQHRRAEAEFTQAWLGFLPSANVSGSYNRNEFATRINVGGVVVTTSPNDQFDGALRIEIPIIDAARWVRAGASAAAVDGSIEREQLTLDQVRRQVVAAWYNYVGGLALRESAKKSLAAAEAQAKLQEIRLNAGAATEIERLRANAERARSQQVVADAENIVALGRRSLRTLTFIDPGDVAPLPQDDLTPPPTLEELEARIEELPAVRAAMKDVLVNERLLLAQRLAVLPTVTANLTERAGVATAFSPRNLNFSAGIGFNWRLDAPTFQGGAVQQTGLSLAQLQAERVRLNAKDQIHADWQRQRAATTKVEAARAQVEAAQRAAGVAKDRYAVGASTQLDVIFAERDVLNAEVGQIQARTDLAAARVSVRISAGLPLSVQ